ncbi:anti-sigma factor family protein [Candidatus Viadribacter manganicus]|uniref:Zinc-finger domain-containing protein n=1 Tax=Candidatus Viadribacter manganicus TaxID=1759059 RepID=A0A1B1AGL4_9PROT|nr:hypothetical protein [Candidatus Viadribacter manganicus]ANP45706.1 hypothetical protein ATE48_07130 [Candidatus Viadribacter manganicus]
MIDEQIGAYLDDELDASQRDVLRRRLSVEAAAAERLDAFARVDSQLRGALAVSPSPSEDPLASKLRSFRRTARQGQWRRQVSALIGVCILGVGVGAGFGHFYAPHGRALPADVIAALDEAPSGQMRSSLSGEISLTQTINTDAGVCRQAQLLTLTGSFALLACRDGQSWVSVASVTTASPSSGHGMSMEAQASIFEAVLAARGTPVLVGADEESERINAHWRVRSSN